MNRNEFALLLTYADTEARRQPERNAQEVLLETIRQECSLNDRRKLRQAVDGDRLTRLRSKRDAQDAERAALDQEIADLESAP